MFAGACGSPGLPAFAIGGPSLPPDPSVPYPDAAVQLDAGRYVEDSGLPLDGAWGPVPVCPDAASDAAVNELGDPLCPEPAGDAGDDASVDAASETSDASADAEAEPQPL